MLKENLKDTGEIVENIITQPLSVPGAKSEISLLEAAKAFHPSEAMSSDLRKILLGFLQFPEPTEMMIRELEILAAELS